MKYQPRRYRRLTILLTPEEYETIQTQKTLQTGQIYQHGDLCKLAARALERETGIRLSEHRER